MEVLRGQLSGALVGPGDDGWDTARQAWNLAVDQRPAAVVLAAGAEDVAATLTFAADREMRVAPQATGHGASSLGALDDTILLRTTRLNGVEVDAARRRARAGAGALWNDVVAPAAEHGLVGLHGLSGGVGVAGYALGGGLGWLGRSHGLACNAVTGLEAVSVDGRPLRVDGESEPDLFWALRGGGASAVVVTAFELELFPLEEAFAGHLAWPLERAPEVVEAYRSWTTGLPDELTSTIRLMRYPPIPELPPELRGQAFAMVILVFAGDRAAGDDLVAPLRDLGSPAADTLAIVPASDLPQIAGDPPGPVPGIGDTTLVTDLDVGAFLAVGGPQAQTRLTNIEMRHLGGALERSEPWHGAADSVEARFAFYGVGTPTDSVSADSLRAELDGAKERLAATASGRTLLTFAERQPGVAGSYPPETVARLQEISRRLDPAGVIRANHTLGV
jgi:FAD binding domain